MPHMAHTEIMTLGRLQPMIGGDWLQNRRVTPQQPQNLLRVVTLSGLHGTARLLHGLGVVGDQALAANTGPVPIVPMGDPVAMNFPSMPAWPWSKPSQTVQIGTVIAAASLSLVSAVVAGYHGYRRDRSAMAGLGWGFMGAIFPVVTPVVAFAQGYARPRGRR